MSLRSLVKDSSRAFHSVGVKVCSKNSICSVDELRGLYQIEESEDIDKRLSSVVGKNILNFGKFSNSRLQNLHSINANAFEKAICFVDSFYANRGTSTKEKLVILDSGCGKGSSTVALSHLYPTVPCIGIDRSLSRLRANPAFNDDDDYPVSIEQSTSERPNLSNCLLIQADLVEFLILAATKSDWIVYKHFLFHPNPYPKHSLFSSRLYGNSLFPVFPLLGGKLFLRSNWKTYCREFLESLRLVQESPGFNLLKTTIPLEVSLADTSFLISSFDKKYFRVSVPMYDIHLDLPSTTMNERSMIMHDINLPRS